MDNGTPTSPNLGDALVAEARRIEEDAIHSAKGHFEAAHRWGRWHFYVGLPTAFASAVAGVAALKNYPTFSAVLALTVAASSAIFTFLNPKERAAAHLKAGNAYKTLHNDARIFREIDCHQSLSPKEVSERLSVLNQRRNTLNSESPQPPHWAFKRARKGIEEGEASYEVDKQSGSVKT